MDCVVSVDYLDPASPWLPFLTPLLKDHITWQVGSPHTAVGLQIGQVVATLLLVDPTFASTIHELPSSHVMTLVPEGSATPMHLQPALQCDPSQLSKVIAGLVRGAEFGISRRTAPPLPRLAPAIAALTGQDTAALEAEIAASGGGARWLQSVQHTEIWQLLSSDIVMNWSSA